jgi:hypothetical protein
VNDDNQSDTICSEFAWTGRRGVWENRSNGNQDTDFKIKCHYWPKAKQIYSVRAKCVSSARHDISEKSSKGSWDTAEKVYFSTSKVIVSADRNDIYNACKQCVWNAIYEDSQRSLQREPRCRQEITRTLEVKRLYSHANRIDTSFVANVTGVKVRS